MRRLAILAALAVAALFAATLATRALLAPVEETSSRPPPAAALSGPLDGRDFAGELRRLDGSTAITDTLHFRDGHFWSAACIRCSFRPGEYWSRSAGDATEFTGVLTSPERGRFDYAGRVEDGEIRVEITWTRSRWYWTLERDYVFVGRRIEPGTGAVNLASAWARSQGERAPDCSI